MKGETGVWRGKKLEDFGKILGEMNVLKLNEPLCDSSEKTVLLVLKCDVFLNSSNIDS